MKQGIIVTTKEFTDFDKRVVTSKRKQGHKLDRWCEKTIHPVSNKLVFRTTEKIEPILSSIEKGKIFDLPKDWFPKPEII